GRGRPKQTILLTPDTFKDLCMMAGTPQGKVARQYFRTMEDIVKKYVLMQAAFDKQQQQIQLEEQTRLLEQQLQAKDDELQAKEQELQAKADELQRYKSKKYEQRQQVGYCYVIQTDGGIKVGKTKNIDQRVKGLQTANTNDVKVLLSFPTCDPDLLERSVHTFLDRYRSNSYREFFDCDAKYIQTVVKVTGTFIDTMGSAYEAITEDELMAKMGERLCIKNLPPPSKAFKKDVYQLFLDEKTVPVARDDKDAWIQPLQFYAHFKTWCQERDHREKAATERKIGDEFKSKGIVIEKRFYNGVNTNWVLGWKLDGVDLSTD
ncbi:hypothetical protein HK102_000807, partial [Quaeritorhiza haematococci]